MTTTNAKFTDLQRYNARDAIATLALAPILKSQLDNQSSMAYNMLQELQAPALRMMLRGMLMNQVEISKAKVRLTEEVNRMTLLLQQFADGLHPGHKWAKVKGKEKFNPNSSTQIGVLFTSLQVEPILQHWSKAKDGIRKPTWDRKALETIREREEDHLLAPIIDLILEIRDRAKLLQVISSPLRNGRMYTSFNIAATNTWRWSSSESAFWDGTNVQNITKDLRNLFIADPGYKLLNIDLKTGDSRIVALDLYARTGRVEYLDACEGSDLHTAVAMMAWPELDWPEDEASRILLAEQVFYRHYTRRFMCKKLGHGTNYYGKAKELALQTRIDLDAVQLFQDRYNAAFGIQDWHSSVIFEVQSTKELTNVFGFRRSFHGRMDQKKSLGEAFAYLGQSGTTIALNKAILRTHYEVPEFELLNNGHDALMGQYPEDREDLVPQVMECFSNPIVVSHNGVSRSHIIPIDVKIGWNWKDAPSQTELSKGAKPNPDGLEEWKTNGADQRTRYYDPAASIMDRRIR